MADVESNLIEHQREFLGLIDGFDFTSVGKDESLGRDIAVKAAEGIIERTAVDQKAAAGGPLKPLNAKYKARKIKDHGVGDIGILTGQMLSLESVLGSVSISAEEVQMAYGTGASPTRYATRGEIKPDEPTDREKADWFTEQGREFYELDDAIAAEIRNLTGEALAEYVRENG